MNSAPVAAIAALGILAALIGLVPQDPGAGAAFSLVWGFALGFISPRRAWLWPLVLGAWLPLGLVTGWLHDQNNGWAGCAHGVAHNWQIALFVLCGIVSFTAAGALAAIVLNAVLNLPALRDVAALRLVKPVLDWGGCAVAIILVVYAGLALAQPLQPFGLNDPYCWDEFCFHVDSVQRVKSLGTGAQRVNARGTFYVVSATLEAPWWGRMDWGPGSAFVMTRDGSEYEHSVEGQRAIDALLRRSSQCHTIPGAAEREVIVFDLPDDALQPRLLVRDALGFEGFLGASRLGRAYVKPAFNLRYD